MAFATRATAGASKRDAPDRRCRESHFRDTRRRESGFRDTTRPAGQARSPCPCGCRRFAATAYACGRCESHFRNVEGCESGFRNAHRGKGE
ncbi:hypothetical protein DMC63_08920 [Streptomyces sp. WAC 05977]|nr:hypothetical protein DMC63_08920 [Streptomyces sp. WAC 05977]